MSQQSRHVQPVRNSQEMLEEENSFEKNDELMREEQYRNFDSETDPVSVARSIRI